MKKTSVFSFVVLVTAACAPDSVVPYPNGSEIGGGNLEDSAVSIAYLKTLYTGAPTLITGEYYISGMAVSSDGSGNFYKTLVLDDGTAGIEIKLDMEDIAGEYWHYSRTTVRCNGLWLGLQGGVMQLGAEPFDGFQTGFLPENMIAEHLTCTRELFDEVKPRKLAFSQLLPRHISSFVAFDDVEFAREEIGLGWAEQGAEGYSLRHLVDAHSDTLAVRTSNFAQFALWMLPLNKLYIEGVLGYSGGEYSIMVCDERNWKEHE